MRWRREQIPEPVSAIVPEGQRILGWAVLGNGAALAATPAGLHGIGALLADHPDPAPWDLIDRAVWEPPLLRLEIRSNPGERATAIQLRMPESESLTAAVQEWVTASVLVQRRFTVGSAGVTFVARRTTTGEVRWLVRPDAELDMADPAVRREVDRLLSDMRSTLGI